MTKNENDFGDFEALPGVRSKAIGALGGDELTFRFPEVQDVISLCSVHQIAVLGIELMRRCRDGLYQTDGLSVYDLSIGRIPETLQEWPEYVKRNNGHAAEFVRQNPANKEQVYVLTTSSWRELGLIKDFTRILAAKTGKRND